MEAAISFCFAFCISGSSSNYGQPRNTAWRGGGSSAMTSRVSFLAVSALKMAAPYSCRSPAAVKPICQRLSADSPPCLETEVSRLFGLGRNTASRAIGPLKWLLCVRNLARFSLSATTSGSPESSVFMRENCGYPFENSLGDSSPIEPCDTMPLVCSVKPRIGQTEAATDAQGKDTGAGLHPVQRNRTVRFRSEIGKRNTLWQRANEIPRDGHGHRIDRAGVIAIPIVFSTFECQGVQPGKRLSLFAKQYLGAFR